MARIPLRIETLSTVASPPSGAISPVSMEMVVVLPAPGLGVGVGLGVGLWGRVRGRVRGKG